MKEEVYVDRLFVDYEDTLEIRDFKEEIAGNLKERVKELISKGLDEVAAFDKATIELGDITAIADDIGKKKRNEAIGQMYIKAKVPMTSRTAGGLAAASGLLLLAVGLALISFFGESSGVAYYYSAAVLLSVACGAYAYFGLTQETAAHYAMGKRRALAYGVVCLAAFLGAGLAVVSFLFNGFDMSLTVGIKTAFILPAICALIFLIATEPKRQKPWLKAMVEREIEKSFVLHRDMVDPAKAAKFGVASSGLWALAVALFLALGFIFSWRFAWLVFPFALAIQVFMITAIFKSVG
jgi:MFS family permease